MAKVLTCVDFNTETRTCEVQAWVDQSDWTTPLPTIEQAGIVGAVYFTGLMTLAVLRGLLFPSEKED